MRLELALTANGSCMVPEIIRMSCSFLPGHCSGRNLVGALQLSCQIRMPIANATRNAALKTATPSAISRSHVLLLPLFIRWTLQLYFLWMCISFHGVPQNWIWNPARLLRN